MIAQSLIRKWWLFIKLKKLIQPQVAYQFFYKSQFSLLFIRCFMCLWRCVMPPSMAGLRIYRLLTQLLFSICLVCFPIRWICFQASWRLASGQFWWGYQWLFRCVWTLHHLTRFRRRFSSICRSSSPSFWQASLQDLWFTGHQIMSCRLPSNGGLHHLWKNLKADSVIWWVMLNMMKQN